MRAIKRIMVASILAIMLAASAALASGSGHTGLPGISLSPYSPVCYQSFPFVLGSEFGGAPALGWNLSPWAFGAQSCTESLPLYFGAHGYGFPFTLGNIRISLVPSGW